MRENHIFYLKSKKMICADLELNLNAKPLTKPYNINNIY